jgi:hypothetical protein
MPSQLDERLEALAAIDSAPALSGLEDQVWTQVQARKAAAGAGSAGVRVAVTALALAVGVAFGVLHQSHNRQASSHAQVAELGLLSEDGALAPSVRLGGGA